MPGWRLVSKDKLGGVYRANGDTRGHVEISDEERRAEEQRRASVLRFKIKSARDLWTAAGYKSVDHAARYVEARGVKIADLPGGRLPGCIRLHPAAPYSYEPARGKRIDLTPGPCMLCAAVDAEGKFKALQRIFLDVHGGPGKRAAIDCLPATHDPDDEPGETKLALAPISGAAVRLWPVGAEIPTFASIVIMADHDRIDRARGFRPGLQFATLAANRLRTQFPRAVVAVCPPTHADAPTLVGPAPGSEDESGDILKGKGVDWLDVYDFGRGADAVRAAVTRAVAAEAARLGVAPPTGPTLLLTEGIETGLACLAATKLCTWACVSTSGLVSVDVPGHLIVGDKVAGSPPPPPPPPPPSSQPEPDDTPEELGIWMVGTKKMMPGGSLDRARLALRALFAPAKSKRASERWTLAYHVGSERWFTFDGICYRDIRPEVIRYRLLEFFNDFHTVRSKFSEKPIEDLTETHVKRCSLSTTAIDEIVTAMQGEVAVHARDLPAWGRPTFGPDGSPRFGACSWPDFSEQGTTHWICDQKGLIALDALKAGRIERRPVTANYINLTAMPYVIPVEEIAAEFARDPDGDDDGLAVCHRLAPRFMAFLEEALGDNPDAVVQLQRFAGLCLTFDMKFETICFLFGPSGSGKGTFLEVLIELVGQRNAVATSYGEFCNRFELIRLIGKPLAYIDEAGAIGHSVDGVEANRRLKTFSAGTPMGAEAKHGAKDDFTPVSKLVLAADQMPRLTDAAAAMARRLLVIPFVQSHKGREDYDLKRKLKAEIAGVAAWAIFGLRSLYRVGRFIQPAKGAEILGELQRLWSPVHAFCEDCVVTQAGSRCTKEVMYDLYRAWCENEGFEPRTKETFSAQLKAAVPTVRVGRHRSGGGDPVPWFEGVRPKLRRDDYEHRRFEAHAVDMGARSLMGPFDFEYPPNQYADHGPALIPT